MTERRSPDEETIIELNEVIEPSATDDSEIIELTDVVATEATADADAIELTDVVATEAAVDANTIELTDVVATEAAADANTIELTDVVATEATTDADVIELTDVVKSTPTVEKVIDLVDVVEEASPMDTPDRATAEIQKSSEPDEAEAHHNLGEELAEGHAADLGKEAFDLLPEEGPFTADSSDSSREDDLDFAPMDLDIEEDKETDLFDSLGMKLEPEIHGATDDEELDFNLSTQELTDAIDLLDAKLAEDTPADSDKSEALSAAVTKTQLEKALENVVREMYGEKIDQLLNEAIEKTVATEIENLKNQLLKESTEC